MKYSIVIPVYNRPDEVAELLGSLVAQSFKDFEVVVVEDGSSVPCQDVVRKFASHLALRYYSKPNSGPGQSRNYGAERSQGEFLIVLDSDCVLPEGYLQAVDDELRLNPCDAFGGPDAAHSGFTDVQKAISYSMTSFLTTGGIRGGKRQLDKKFYPRSFNMGVRSELWNQLGGFSSMRFGEDIDFSIRIYAAGARCRLFPNAWVWHKRRTDMTKFFKQVHNSGIARINLTKRHPGTLKLVHMLPALFTLGVVLLLACFVASVALYAFGSSCMACCHAPLFCLYPLLPLLLYSALICVDSSARNRSLRVGFLSVPAVFIQLIGYGSGFLRAWWLRCLCGRNEELQAFRNNFYE